MLYSFRLYLFISSYFFAPTRESRVLAHQKQFVHIEPSDGDVANVVEWFLKQQQQQITQ